MKTLIILCLFWISIYPSTCQSLSNSDQKKFSQAVESRKTGQHDKALKTLDKLIEKYPEDLELFTEKGMIYMELENDSLAIDNFEQAWDINPNDSYRLTYTLANLYKNNDRYEDALSKLEHFHTFKEVRPAQKTRAERLEKEIHFTREAKANPQQIELERLSSNINTDNPEYLPAFSADGKIMIYTKKENRQEDFYISNFDGESFSPGMPILDLNTPQNEASPCLSPDGDYLFFSANYREKSQGGFDIYITTKKDSQWIKPINMGSVVNSRDWDAHPSLTPDGKRLYFASDRPGGKGKSDIWYTDFKDGLWTKPINAGDEINTAGNEESPFIHLDGQTLYFRSDGHIGLGKHDLFLARWENNTWKSVQNLGFPINSDGIDGALTISTNGKYAYYTSGAEDANLDIFRFELPEEFRPQRVTYFKAKIFDADTKQPMKAAVEVYDINEDQTYLSDVTNQRGVLLASIPERSQYSIHVSAPDYVFYSDNIVWSDSSTVNNPQEINIFLDKIKIPEIGQAKKETEPVVLKNIFFESGSDQLLDISSFEINKLATILKDSPEVKIRITGHTDNVGGEEANQVLSLNRATAVKNALVEKGINTDRVIVQGMGEAKPIESNETEIGRQNNRRVEFVLIRK